MSEESHSYRAAGVDVAEGRRAVERMRTAVEATHTAAVLGGLGGFGALYHLEGFRDPVLVSGSDGVGTKVELARGAARYDTIGIDLVAMCVNDIICHGARPLFFLDYIAVDTLDAAQVADLVAGVAAGCREAGCALVGGETAEMPGVYRPGRFDLAGFAVGAVERSEVVDGRDIAPGMAVVGLASSGVHSNGFSLVRRLFPELDERAADGHDVPPRGAARATVAERSRHGDLRARFLTPTRIYVDVVRRIAARVPIAGMAHVTGGGWVENLPRALGVKADTHHLVVERGRLPPAEEFGLIAARGVEEAECYRTFNMGVGFALIVDATALDDTIAVARAAGVDAARIGTVEAGVAPDSDRAFLSAPRLVIR